MREKRTGDFVKIAWQETRIAIADSRGFYRRCKTRFCLVHFVRDKMRVWFEWAFFEEMTRTI